MDNVQRLIKHCNNYLQTAIKHTQNEAATNALMVFSRRKLGRKRNKNFCRKNF